MDQFELQDRFEQLTGFQPLPWQSRLFLEYFDRDRLPAAVDIPTGLGKTPDAPVAAQSGKSIAKRNVLC
jgi:CRISPR-associated endonuclease/helicase Cas3